MEIVPITSTVGVMGCGVPQLDIKNIITSERTMPESSECIFIILLLDMSI
jgi:hypothetical protein